MKRIGSSTYPATKVTNCTYLAIKVTNRAYIATKVTNCSDLPTKKRPISIVSLGTLELVILKGDCAYKGSVFSIVHDECYGNSGDPC